MARQRAKTSSPTIRDVAQVAGVAASTVSRVFSQPQRLSADTVTRIRSIAAEMGYEPDHTARSLSTGRTDTVALLVPDVANPFFPPLIKGVERYLQARGVAVLLAETDEEAERESSLTITLRGRADGVIIASPRGQVEDLMAITGDIPLVLVNRDIPGAHRVLIDTVPGMRQAVAHLAELGHRRLAYLGGPERSWSNAERVAAFVSAAQEHGLEAVLLQSDRPDYPSGWRAVHSVLESKATGVIAYDDVLAQGLMAGLAEQGLGVPSDLSIVGCDDLVAPVTVPPMTSIQTSAEQAGVKAAQQLEKLLARPRGTSQGEDVLVDVLPSRLCVRASTGPPRRL
ncbi:MAG TPA: LacI family DNA-binding transcriptional regulator [Propionibacteriaceae bacterium]|nr:LacI family DNA-binding transcriptional regulator [Propionibacteriaceae bacterium]